MDAKIAKELATIRATIYDCMKRLNDFSDMRDDSIEVDVDDTQIGLAETFEATVATADDLTQTQMALAEVYELVIGG